MAEARSLADIKLDNAYKFGAGRYLQEAGALNLLGGEVARLGNPLVWGGQSAAQAHRTAKCFPPSGSWNHRPEL